eukprot:SAG31_NODE_197_length_20660_cov_8.861368_16_plen_142_part_00
MHWFLHPHGQFTAYAGGVSRYPHRGRDTHQTYNGRMPLIQHGVMRSVTLPCMQTEVTLRTGSIHQVCIATKQTYSEVDGFLTAYGLESAARLRAQVRKRLVDWCYVIFILKYIPVRLRGTACHSRVLSTVSTTHVPDRNRI